MNYLLGQLLEDGFFVQMLFRFGVVVSSSLLLRLVKCVFGHDKLLLVSGNVVGF